MLPFLLVACAPGGSSDLRPVTLDTDADETDGADTDAPAETGAPPATGPGTDGAPALVINEFLASNLTGLQDDAGERPDWIELYNPGTADVPLAGWALADALEPDAPAPLDASLVVPAGGWLLLWADDAVTPGPTHLPFALAADGGELALLLDGEPVDLLRYGPQASDWSAARAPDAGATWIIDETPTPGTANDVD